MDKDLYSKVGCRSFIGPLLYTIFKVLWTLVSFDTFKYYNLYNNACLKMPIGLLS